jgi:hypothetical protein
MIADLVFFCEALQTHFFRPFSAFALVVVTRSCDVHRNCLRFSHSYYEQEVQWTSLP